MKCNKCEHPYSADEDSGSTIKLVGLCEDCMSQQDWDRFYYLDSEEKTMNECCKSDGSCEHQKDFWGWWKEKEKTFTADQVKDLLERVKVFNAGAIDSYLTNHVDKVFNEWANEVDE